MFRHCCAIALALCSLVSATDPLASYYDTAPYYDEEMQEEEGYIINFNNVSIVEYIRFVSKITNTSFVFDESELDFTVTIVSEEPASADQVMSILLQVLKVRGLSMAEQGNQILVSADRKLARLGEVVTGDVRYDDEAPIVTRVFRVENNPPGAMAKLVTPLLSDDALVQASDETGQLIVTDLSANIDRVANLLNALDLPVSEVDIAEYQVEYSDIQSLISLTTRILEPMGGGQVTLVPQDKSGTIFLVGTPYLISRALNILQRLDVAYGQDMAPAETKKKEEPPAAPKEPWSGPKEHQYAGPKDMGAHDTDGVNFFIYKLQYHQGDEIGLALRDIASSLEASGAGALDLVSTISTVQWIKASNSLVFSGNRSSLDKMRRLVQDLDVPLHQVFIEALIMRTTISNGLNIGVEWGANAAYEDPNNPNSSVGLGGVGSTQGTSTNPLTGAAEASPLNQRINNPLAIPNPLNFLTGGFDLGVVGRLVSLNDKLFTSFGAIINAVQEDQDSRIMLNPKIITQDNHTAEIFVGTNQAFIESTVSEPGSTILSGALEYRDVGSSLKITPLLGNSDLVTLDIEQSLSNNDGAAPANAASNPIRKSVTSTRVTVPDGYFLMLAGQIATTDQTNQKGFPCLGALPVVGLAFSRKALTDTRDNLIIFIRPHIIRSHADMVRLTEKENCCYEAASTQREFQLSVDEFRDILNINATQSQPCD